MVNARGIEWRWLAVIPAAVAGAAVAQLAVTGPAHGLLHALTGPETGDALWQARSVASLFMGAAFVGGAWLAAPARKVTTSLLALGAVAAWAAVLGVSAAGDGVVWPAVMGGAGLVGAALALGLLRRRARSV